MPHPLLPEQLRSVLPLLKAQRHRLEPMVFARYGVADEAWQFFPIEGEPSGADYVFFGLLMPREDDATWSWRELRLSELVTVVGVKLDPNFVAGTFPDVVPYPYID